MEEILKVCENCYWFRIVYGIPMCDYYDCPVLRDGTCEDFQAEVEQCS